MTSNSLPKLRQVCVVITISLQHKEEENSAGVHNLNWSCTFLHSVPPYNVLRLLLSHFKVPILKPLLFDLLCLPTFSLQQHYPKDAGNLFLKSSNSFQFSKVAEILHHT